MNDEIVQVNSPAQELPPIFKHNFNGVTKNAVYFRDLYNKLGLDETSFTKWCKNNIEYIFTEEEEWYLRTSSVNRSGSHKGGRKAFDYIVPVDIAKELSMLARTEQGKLFRRMFIEAEKRLTSRIQQEMKKVEIGEETSKFFNNLLESASIYSSTVRLTLGAAISEKIYGIKIPYAALPSANQPRIMATDIGNEIGISNIAVGKIAKRLNLQRMPYAERKWSMAPGLHKEVQVWYYGEEAVRLIKEEYRKSLQLE